MELQSCREKTSTYDSYISRDTEQDTREKANMEKSIELERQAAELARKERDLAQEERDLYKQLYQSVTKKPGIGCRILRVLSAGIVRCQ
jgi:hypothetical protein